ncbi:hypothetical protein GCM10011349_28990 [Novosphingobium indicum]|uniref:DUF2059 domain-containing protein n=1 Tax=Novosphingobium indicum TaxID=462949 RepID=A0ABQ2JR20_9SPHN|nr:DUF2059 domain-containing protein [Novosphingobium indicum]GGN53904.1 hypothetical protein GCM10011349_28990 [Novosphingobium indicum]
MSRILAALSASALMLGASPAMAAEPDSTAQAEAPVDPARLAAARQTVDYVFPAGTYARIMNATMDKIMDSVMDSVGKMPIKDLAGMGGVDTSKLSSASLSEIMAIYDPHYKERMTLTTHTMMGEMTTMMTEFEPEIRDGLAHAYAAKFDVKQLGELNAFFATPTGSEYAADSYMIMMSPKVMDKMQAFMPKMMKQMPAIVEKVKTATADLPPPRKYADLSDAERAELADLLGISVAELEEQQAAKSE